MEKRINIKIREHTEHQKNELIKRVEQLEQSLSLETRRQLNSFITDLHVCQLDKTDFLKRNRVKNIIPLSDRCCAKRANSEQCTRRRKKEFNFCGTHIKGTPCGIINNEGELPNTQTHKEIWLEDINGIMYYLDNDHNVYKAEDIMSNKINPSIQAKWDTKDGMKIIENCIS